MKKEKSSNEFTAKIGNATYKVTVHFNKNSKEDFNDKLIRLIKNDIVKNKKAM
ncbi:MAG: transposon-encoded TnpW family protein [Oscillospiraceae bacterium]|nr:transposon-encoded TnpW family protein [Oscillospiraceae bacterium]